MDESSRVTSVGSLIEGRNVNIQAGENLNVMAGRVSGSNDVTLRADKGDVILGDAVESAYNYKFKSNSGLFKSSAKASQTFETTAIGSFVSGENVNVRARDNVLITGSHVAAQNDLGVMAEKGDIVIAASQDSHEAQSKSAKSDFKFGNLLLSPLLTATGKDTIVYSKVEERSKDVQVINSGSVLSAGNKQMLEAGRDVSVIGSLVEASNDLQVSAERDVNIIPGRENFVSESQKKRIEAGLWNSLAENGLSFFIGLKSQESGLTSTGNYSAGSLLSGGNDVIVEAGRNVNQAGGHIKAGRDIAVDAGQDWNMMASFDHETLHQFVKTVESGISASVRQNVTGAVRDLSSLPSDLQRGTGGGRYSIVTASSAGLRAIDSVMSAINDPFSVSAKVGGSYSKTSFNAQSGIAQPSSVLAGRDIKAGAGRDINMEGSVLGADNDINLAARRDVNIAASAGTGDSKFSGSGGGGGVGVKAGIGSGGPYIGLNVSAQAFGSKYTNEYRIYSNSIIGAGNTLSVESGRDTNIFGASLEGQDVWMYAGGDLKVASLQDYYRSKSGSWNVGADFTAGYGVNVNMSGYLGFGNDSANADKIRHQTSIIGRDVVDIKVESNTALKASIIASDTGRLILDTGTFTYENINDKDKGGSIGAAISGSYNSALSDRDNTRNPIGGNRVPTFGLKYESHEGGLINRATVGEGLIIVRNDEPGVLDGLNRDLASSQEVTKDKKVYMDMYISPSAMASLADGLEGDLGKAWAFIYTAPGLLAGGADSLYKVISGEKTQVSTDYNAYGFGDSFVGAIGDQLRLFSAITFGNTVHYNSETNFSSIGWSYPRIGEEPYPVDIGRHEEGHTYQYQYIGPAYPLFYYLNGPGDGHNFLEKGADEYGAVKNKPNWKVGK